MTIQSSDMHNNLEISAIGHFSIHIDNYSGGYKFFDKPEWVNS
ncbi:17922_t:CDS:1, partial [Funneliformis caledonium]